MFFKIAGREIEVLPLSLWETKQLKQKGLQLKSFQSAGKDFDADFEASARLIVLLAQKSCPELNEEEILKSITFSGIREIVEAAFPPNVPQAEKAEEGGSDPIPLGKEPKL